MVQLIVLHTGVLTSTLNLNGTRIRGVVGMVGVVTFFGGIPTGPCKIVDGTG